MVSSGSSKQSILKLVLTLGLLVGSLSGCGLDGLLSLPDDGTEQNTVTSDATLRVYGSLPPTLDPAMAQDATSAEYIVHLFSGLVRLNADMEVVADLASEWSLNDAGDVYTFTIRDDACFADGRSITAEDILYSWERALSPELASPVALSYLGDIRGAVEYAAGASAEVSGIYVTGTHELRVELNEPRSSFISCLTYPVAFVVDSEQIESEGARWFVDPNGSGPFVLESISAEKLILERNGNYYGPEVSLDHVEYLVGSGYPVTQYETGELDIVPIPADELERLLDPANDLSDQVVGSASLDIQYIGLNVEKAPFDDPLVRQAFTEAIDRERIAEQILKGIGVEALGILPPGLSDYNEDLQSIPYDPEHARELLEMSSYGGAEGLPPIVLAESGTSGYLDDIAAAVIELLEENLSIEVTVEQVEWSDFLDDLTEMRYQMYFTGWIADYPDADNFLDLLFYSSSSRNHTGYANTEVDSLLDAARSEQDANVRRGLYQAVEQIIVDDAAWIPLYHSYNYYLVSPRVKGYQGQAVVYPWLMDIELADAS